jgi:hypothetical protein
MDRSSLTKLDPETSGITFNKLPVRVTHASEWGCSLARAPQNPSEGDWT